MDQMKDQAIVCNIGHFDNEIDVAGLAISPGRRSSRRWTMSSGRRQADHPSGEGASGQPGLRDGASLVCHEFVVRQPGARADRAVAAPGPVRGRSGLCLPKHLDEKVARLQLSKLGAMLTELTPEQATYIGVTPEGPYKSDTYRY
jgi:adenosylhomocysteinase